MDFQSWLATICCCICRQRGTKNNLRSDDKGRGIDETRGAGALDHLHECLRVAPLAALIEVTRRLVDDDLAVLGRQRDLRALEGPRGRALEIDPRDVVTRAVARALELVLRR